MAWEMPKHINLYSPMFHLPGGSKRIENSERGMLRAMNGPFGNWDGDLQKSADQVPLNTHWPDPIKHDKFRDPEGEFHSPYHVGQHPAEVTMRFVSPGGYVIRSVHSRFVEAANNPKPDPHFAFGLEPKGPHWDENDMEQLWQWAHMYERPTFIKCAYSAPLRAARRVGFQTRYTVDHKPGM